MFLREANLQLPETVDEPGVLVASEGADSAMFAVSVLAPDEPKRKKSKHKAGAHPVLTDEQITRARKTCRALLKQPYWARKN